ncbi:VWA domain-containing protein [Roseomonas sp. SSH11]|uniref:VWA domain-containing protein n=1 Tax=Pararoseomonas baculiformis TaxID=2820812 RepID=A0ABS4AIN6_9PROT|nr:VWA domain-containing protein [Pararoseomonas baculiformis]MBP0446866.1 VWA domain-containing protein [Pararoseomonas baculiformis]
MAKPPVPAPASSAVTAFLQKAAGVPALRAAPSPARLLFAVDATASRQPTWDRACHLQAGMFAEAPGGIAVSLAFYRGHGEFHATPFLADARALAAEMTGVGCRGGHTQILRLLRHAEAEASRARLHALVFVGDAVEEEAGPILAAASRLGARGTPAFVFQEGDDPLATPVLRGIARQSGGAWAPFDHRSPGTLAALLRGAAAFASGGRAALARLPGAAALLAQLPAPRA